MSEITDHIERDILAVTLRKHSRTSLPSVPTNRVNWQLSVSAAGLLGAFVILLTIIQFTTPNLVGNDGYYHIRMAQLMRTEGLKPPFDWLPLTVLNANEFVDHHFLYHVLLIPFTLGDLRVGAKAASVVFPALAFLAVWWLLRGQKVPYAALWSLGLLIVSEAFVYRMSMPRTQALSLGFLVLAIHWLLTGRHRLLLPLAFFYVWLYNAFPLILLVTGAYVLTGWLTHRRLEWQVLILTSLGVILGLVVNPYFPDNLAFIFRHIGPKLADPTAIKVGSEWYPYDTVQLIENSGLALVAFMAGILALGMHDRRMGKSTATVLLVALLCGAMLFKSRRFIEYFPAFALIFCALAWNPILRGWLDSYASPMTRPSGAQARIWKQIRRITERKWILASLMAITIAAGLVLNLGPTRHGLQRTKPYQRYAGAAGWLENNTPPSARVFQTDWDDFPSLFFYNTHNTYTLGLDPTYMQLYDQELFDLWVDITKGRVDHPARTIAQEFGASYVFTDLKHDRFLEQAAKDPGLLEVFRDEDAAVFQVIERLKDGKEQHMRNAQ
jgi:hypothetical protein